MTGAVASEAAGAGVAATPFAIGDVAPTAVIEPTTEEECADALRRAIADGCAILPWGAGTCLDTGMRLRGRSYAVLRTSRLGDRIEVAEGDSLVTASAGVPFSALQEAVAAKRQRLDIDPPFADKATVGGVVAANAYGLLRCSAGAVADLIVAARMVTGAGEVVKTGAHVVKNAAGYSLSRLIAGSHGSLAIITEVTFRTNPRPPARLAGFARASDVDLAAVAALGLQNDLPSLDYVAVIGDKTSHPAVVFGMSGTDGFVRSASDAASGLLARFGLEMKPDEASCDDLAEQARRTLHGCSTDAALRVSVPPSRGAEAASALARASDRWVWLVPSGIVAAGIVGDQHQCRTRLAGAAAQAIEQGGRGLWLRQPPGTRFRRIIRPSSPIEDRLVRSAKAAFDPAATLSPGRIEGD